MNIREILSSVRDELDAQQISVRFEETDAGIVVHSENYASKVIAKAELRRRGVIVIDR